MVSATSEDKNEHYYGLANIPNPSHSTRNFRKKIYSQHIFAPNRLIEEKPHLVLCPNSGNKQNASSGLGQVATETITELNELWSVNIVRMP